MHALGNYGLMSVMLYENISRLGRVAIAYDYPVTVHGRYLASPSPIPTFDNPKLDNSPALALFGAGREKRIYAIPPYTRVRSLEFDDFAFTTQNWEAPCRLCGSTHTYLDQVGRNIDGSPAYVCSDTYHCKTHSQGRSPA